MFILADQGLVPHSKGQGLEDTHLERWTGADIGANRGEGGEGIGRGMGEVSFVAI